MSQLKFTLSILFVVFGVSAASAQGLVDGSFQSKGHGGISGSYIRTYFNDFYVGETLVEGVPEHNEITQNIYNLYANYGVTDDLTIIANLPFFVAKGDGNPDPINNKTQESAFQDVALYAKYRPFSAQLGETTTLSGITAVGVNIPTGYEANGILSIGSGATTIDFNVGAHLQTESGLFATAVVGYGLRGEAENTGDGADFDVPNNLTILGKIGYATSKFSIDAFYRAQNSTSGVDIMGEGFMGNFPETEVDFAMIGASGYLPLTEHFGLSAFYGTLLTGRNVGDSNYVGGGLSYSF